MPAPTFPPWRWLEQRRDYAPLFIRLFAGIFLIYMSHDNVVSWGRMLEFRDFLAQQGFPLPLVSAVVSVTAQFTAGILLLLGAWARLAALVMVINFVIAILMVHLELPFREALDPAAMLACSLFLLFNGAGRPSIDAWRIRQRT